MQPDPAVETVVGLVDWIIRGGLVGFLLLVLFGGHFDLWRYGSASRRRDAELAALILELKKSHQEATDRLCQEHKEQMLAVEKDRDEWKAWSKELLSGMKSMVHTEEVRPRR